LCPVVLTDDIKGERKVRHTLQPLKEVWIKVGLEKVNTYEGVMVKALLDSCKGNWAHKSGLQENP